MSGAALPLVLAAASAALYGTGDFLGGLATRRATALGASLFSQALGLVLLAVALPLVPGAPRGADLAWGAASGVAGGTGVLLLYHSLARYTVSTAAPLISLLSLAVPVGVGLALGDRPGPLAIAGIAAGALAVVLVSRGEDDAHSGRAPLRGVPPAVLACGLLIGLFLVALGRVQSGAGLLPLVLGRVTGIATFLLMAAIGRASLVPPASAWRPIAGAGVADVSANLLYVAAAQSGPLSLVATIVSLAPAATVVLAQAVLHERLTVAQKAGVALALGAVVMLARGALH